MVNESVHLAARRTATLIWRLKHKKNQNAVSVIIHHALAAKLNLIS